ncbi:hypothetical protein C1J03_19520 [Sulfitobacter sp. SK012]|uniref:6-phosphogluconolactonase n=1 Tax=Sulfitobacter sp. SK012 TaxID=1389005 RepID=UPI000E0C2A41|nr:6-phosphogluconolactonase [Sulfitobacter sp. SK012]AXI47996.1 hypothetical protein C1J03_19520 [Sulfitobacter sp. SK012]
MAQLSFCPDPVAEATKQIHEGLLLALSQSAERVGLMVSGGRTPAKVLPMVLSKSGIDWDRIDIVASDERLVGIDDPASTEGMIRRIFSDAGCPCHYIGFGADPAPEAALEKWRAGVAAMAWPPAVAFVGIGDDAHTASLFPGRPESADVSLRMAAVPETVPHAHARLTFGPAALAECASVVLVVGDADKQAALDLAVQPETTPSDTPVRWVCDLQQALILCQKT